MEKAGITTPKAVIVGGSAGSFDVVMNMLPRLKPGLAFPIVIIQHRSKGSDEILVNMLATKTALPVNEAMEKMSLQPGTIYIAPADYHLLIENDGTFSLDDSEKVNYCRPSIDVGFISAADVYKQHLVCILLSGSNNDGAEAMRIVKQNGGTIVIEDPETASVPYMPKAVLKLIKPDVILNSDALAHFINAL